ncbi:hypothetical protein [Microbispora sp. NPDC049125]|uniref:hypothetical protein n=1 Tax=Microbispora sp. NPDC049125 TaxID=3154929 RepID=UPI003466914F
MTSALLFDEARTYLESETDAPLSLDVAPCSCRHSRTTHAGAKGNGRCSECGCARFRINIAYELAVQAQEADQRTALEDIATWLHRVYPRPEVDEGGLDIGASDHDTCRRQIYLRNVHPELGTDPVDESAAVLGEIWHDMLTRALASLYRWYLAEVPVRVPELDRDGRADLINLLRLCVEDIKTCGPYTWQRIGDKGPKLQHWKQLATYAKALRAIGIMIERMRLRYIDRATGQEEIFEMAYDEYFALESVNDLVRMKIAIRMRDEDAMPRDGSGPTSDAICREYCLAGETEVVTRDGIKQLRDLAGQRPALLVPARYPDGGLTWHGEWWECDVRSYGIQPLRRVELRRGRQKKVVYATPEHRWITSGIAVAPLGLDRAICDAVQREYAAGETTQRALAAKYGISLAQVSRVSTGWRPDYSRRPVARHHDWRKVTTDELKPGMRLRSIRRNALTALREAPFAVAQGFVYGDGSAPHGSDAAGSLMIYKASPKDKAMLSYFSGHEIAEQERGWRVGMLPRTWKDAPRLDENRSFLLSWLAGYVAADGTVSKSGQVVVHSARRDSIDLVRSICAIVGVGYGPVATHLRTGLGQTEPSELHSVNIRAADLPEWFFKIEEHRLRAAVQRSTDRRTDWTVHSVKETDRVEEVFCAEVPDVEAFALADELLTMNCRFRSACWNIPAAEAAGVSPEFYTILGPDAEPKMIEEIAATVHEWDDLRKESKKQYDAVLPILNGAPAGTYGIYVVSEKTRRMPDYKSYFERIERARAEYLAWPEEGRGDLADWISRIELTYRTDVWTEVKLVRAAQRAKAKKGAAPKELPTEAAAEGELANAGAAA